MPSTLFGVLIDDSGHSLYKDENDG